MDRIQSSEKIQKWYKPIPFLTAFVVGSLGALISIYSMISNVKFSTLSTAALGYLDLPLVGFFSFILFGFLGYCLGIIIKGIIIQNYRKSLGLIASLIIIIVAVPYFINDKIRSHKASEQIRNIIRMNNPILLDQTFSKYSSSSFSYFSTNYNIYIIAIIAQNPYSSADLLDKIAHLNTPRVNDQLAVSADLTPNNRKGLAVIRLVARNPNVNLSTLIYLASHSKNYYLLGDLAGNRKMPPDVLRQLYNKSKESEEGYLIDWGLAYNVNTPPDILRELARRSDFSFFDTTQSILKNNPNLPPDVKNMIQKKSH
jgi:TM2 domain-containing membrane protein YozV